MKATNQNCINSISNITLNILFCQFVLWITIIDVDPMNVDPRGLHSADHWGFTDHWAL